MFPAVIYNDAKWYKQCSQAWNMKTQTTSGEKEVFSRRVMQLIQDCPAIPTNGNKKLNFHALQWFHWSGGDVQKKLHGALLTSRLGVVGVMARCLFISKYRTVILLVSCPLIFSCSSQLATFTLRHLYGITNVRINTVIFWVHCRKQLRTQVNIVKFKSLKRIEGRDTFCRDVFRICQKKRCRCLKNLKKNLDASHQVGVVCYNFRPAIFSQKLFYTLGKSGDQ